MPIPVGNALLHSFVTENQVRNESAGGKSTKERLGLQCKTGRRLRICPACRPAGWTDEAERHQGSSCLQICEIETSSKRDPFKLWRRFSSFHVDSYAKHRVLKKRSSCSRDETSSTRGWERPARLGLARSLSCPNLVPTARSNPLRSLRGLWAYEVMEASRSDTDGNMLNVGMTT